MIVLRLLGFIWSLPLTWIGFLVAAFCDPQSIKLVGWVLEVRAGRWLPGYAAFTCGHIQIYVGDPEVHRRHELVHTLQGDILGVLNVPLYFLAGLLAGLARLVTWWGRGPLDLLRYGYRWNVFEIWAREASK